jgi:predicted transcriptional regulator
MIITEQRITLISTRKPRVKNVNESLKWLGASLGLFNLRDKDQSCFRIFIEILKDAKTNSQGVSSDDLAYRLNLTRGTVVHHLNRLMKAGLVVNNHNKYTMRVDSLNSLIEEIELDFKRTVGEMKKVARDIDHYLGL